jgi:hypothetical protein
MLRRSMRRVLLLSLIYALAANALMYAAYFARGIVKWNLPIGIVLVAAYAVPIVLWFRNRHWYFPAFIFLFWIPFSVLIGYGLSLLLPLEQSADYSMDLLVVVYLIVNVIITLLGLATGMLVNGILALRSRSQAR